MGQRWIELLKTYDMLEAEMIRGLLESGGIPVVIRSAKVSPYPVNIGRMGEVSILVPEAEREKADEVLRHNDRSCSAVSAAVDAGSNTIRLLIGRVCGNRIERIFSDRIITRLAEGVVSSGSLRSENIARSISALRKFSDSIAEYGADKIRAVGTSAVREAKNSREFIDSVFDNTGIVIEAVSGYEEALLTASGVLFGMEKTVAAPFIIDIGGGSTEWIIQDRSTSDHPLLFNSLSLGVVKLFEQFFKTDPPSTDELSAIDSEITGTINAEETRMGGMLRGDMLIGTGGTVTTLAAIDLGLSEYDGEKVHMHLMSLKRLSSMRDMLLSMPFDKRSEIKGLESGRADLIIPGILLTIRVMEILGYREITASDYGMLEGILAEMADR